MTSDTKRTLCALAFGLVWTAAQSQQPSPCPFIWARQEQYVTSSCDSDAHKDPRGTEANPFFVEKVITSDEKREQQDISEDRREHAANERKIVVATIVLATVTSFLMAATILLWLVTRDLFVGSERSSQIGLRAYVGPAPSAVAELGDGNAVIGWRVLVTFTNTGRTAARNVFTSLNVGVFGAALDETFDFADLFLGDRSAAMIAPAHNYLTAAQFFSKEDIDKAATGEKYLYMWGWIEYDDVFGKPRRTFREFIGDKIRKILRLGARRMPAIRHRVEFCYLCFVVRIAGDPQVSPFFFGNHSSHNGMDEDCKYSPGQTPQKPSPQIAAQAAPQS